MILFQRLFFPAYPRPFLAAIGCVACLYLFLSCDCPPDGLAKARTTATHIFTGKVVRMESNWMSGGTKYTFEVHRYWGKPSDNILIVSTAFKNKCGYPFEEGREYLVYATKKFTLKTMGCSGTVPLGDATSLIAALGEGEAPHPSSMIYPMIWTVAILGLLSLVFVGIVVTRKPKPRS